MKLVMWIAGTCVLAILAMYFGFRARRSAGAGRSNDLDVRYGGGSFGVGIASGVMQLVWGALALAAGLSSVLAFTQIGQSLNAEHAIERQQEASPLPVSINEPAKAVPPSLPFQTAGTTESASQDSPQAQIPPVLPKTAAVTATDEQLPVGVTSSQIATPAPLNQAITTSAGLWVGVWECGPVLTSGARSPSSFSIPLQLRVRAGGIAGERRNAKSIDAFRGEVGGDGNFTIAGEGHWFDEPSRNWTTHFEGQIEGDKLSANGVMTSRDGKTKLRDCQLAMSSAGGIGGEADGGKP